MRMGMFCFLGGRRGIAHKIFVVSKSIISKAYGREAFGLDPAGYHAARPAYPDWIYELLCERCGLRQNAATFEIGAGTGIATRRLLELGANPLVAIEPNGPLADFLSETISCDALTVIRSSFEDAILPEAAFDLGFSATAFHWLDEETALIKVAALLKPGGWWVMVWNDFGDPDRADSFHEATKLLLNGPSSPSAGDREIPFAQDKRERLDALEQIHAFDNIEHRTSAWSLVLDPDEIVNLYSTYSNISIRPDREVILAELFRIARDEFQGSVTRNMLTSLYMARRI
jgi:SAM-dependent methyltransferase